MVWPASSAARRFRSPGGARSASLSPRPRQFCAPASSARGRGFVVRGGEASRVDGDVADAGGPLCDAQLAGTRGHVTAILAAHVRDAGADPRLRRPPARPASSPGPCPPHRASPSAHQSPIAPPLPRPLFRSLLYPIADSRAEYDRKGGAQGSLSSIPVGMRANGAPENPAVAGNTCTTGTGV